jgi:hypothetical protein
MSAAVPSQKYPSELCSFLALFFYQLLAYVFEKLVEGFRLFDSETLI